MKTSNKKTESILSFVLYINISIIISFSSCIKESEISIEKSIVYNSERNMIDFLDKIEVTALETNENCLLNNIKKIQYYSKGNFYLIIGNDQCIYIFNEDGKFIRNSKKLIGNGPNDYYHFSDAIYNNFNETFDLLNPLKEGEIIIYDKYLQKKSSTLLLNKGKKSKYNCFIALSDTSYIIAESVLTDKEPSIHFYNFPISGDPIINSRTYSGYVSAVSMSQTAFSQTSSSYYTSPKCIDYYFYEIDLNNYSLEPVFALDFEDKNLSKKMLTDKFGKDNLEEKTAYLLSSNYPLPLTKLISDTFIYTNIVTNRISSCYVYNRITKKSYLWENGEKLSLPPFRDLIDNVLFAFVEVDDIPRYINKKFMNSEDLAKLDSIKEDDNPVILKYYLK